LERSERFWVKDQSREAGHAPSGPLQEQSALGKEKDHWRFGAKREIPGKEQSREAGHAPSGPLQEQSALGKEKDHWRFGAKRQKKNDRPAGPCDRAVLNPS
jgi:hypothetical protein